MSENRAVVAVAERSTVGDVMYVGRGWSAPLAFPKDGSTRTRWLEIGGGEVDLAFNLMPSDPRRGAWDSREAWGRAMDLWNEAAVRDWSLVLLGHRVCVAFEVEPIFGRESGACVRCLAFPHPSGCNRMLNDREFRRAMRAKLISFCRRMRTTD